MALRQTFPPSVSGVGDPNPRSLALRRGRDRGQAPLGPYIVDFVCFERKLVLEVDGGQPLESVGDKFRDHWLEAEGFRVLRFWNPEVLNDVETVLAAISAAVQRLRCPASP